MIGVLEIALALGLFLPLLLCISPIVSEISATGMGIVMLSATFLHVRRKEIPLAILTIAVGLIAFFIAYQTCLSYSAGCSA